MKLLNLNGPQAIMALMVRRKWWIIVPFLGLSAAATLLTYMLPKLYVSSSKILIQPREVPSDFVKDLMNGTADQRLSVIAQKVLTRDNLVKILNNPPKFAVTPGEIPDPLAPPPPALGEHAEFRNLNMDDKVLKLFKQINLKFAADQQIANGQLPVTTFQITYQSGDARTAQAIAATVTDLFLSQDRQIREDSVNGTATFLDAKVNELSDLLAASDKKLSDFRSRHRYELPTQMEANFQTVSVLRTENQNIDNNLIVIQDRLAALEKQIVDTPAEVPKPDTAAVTSPTVIVQNQKIADYRAKQRDLKEWKGRGYSDSYPPVRTLISTIQSLEKDMTPEELAIANGKEDKPAAAALAAKPEMMKNRTYEVLQDQKHNYEMAIKFANDQKAKNTTAIDEAESHIRKAPIGEQEYSDILRENLDLSRRYQEMKDKQSIAGLSLDAERQQKGGNQFVVLESPSVPFSPAKPVKAAIIGAGVGLSLLIGLAFAIIVDIANQKMWTQSDIESLLGATVLVEIPEIVTPDDLIAAKKKRTIQTLTLVAAAAVYAVGLYVVFKHQGPVLHLLDPLIQRLY